MSKVFNLVVLTIICLLFFLASITTSVVLTNQNYNTTPDTDWIMVGGVTPSSAEFRIRSAGVNFRLSTSYSLENPILDTQVANEESVYSVNVTTLVPDTTYYYATSRQGTVRRGSFSTPGIEGTPFNFKIAVGGCAWTGSKSEVFRQIAAHKPLFMLHLGDFHYKDIDTDDMALRINAIDLVLGSESQRELYSKVPIVYTWDDHDWLGNDSGRNETEEGARETALSSYQVAFPHYPLALEGGAVPIYHAFTIGTVRFIVSDLRSESTSTSIYSNEQRDWLLNELSQADQYDFVIWASSKPWIGQADKGEDSWLGQADDRRELSEFISLILAKTQNLLAVSSDSHMLAFDNGKNTYYGDRANSSSFPILQSGPMDRLGSIKGGPFSDGCYTTKAERNHQYSTISFDTVGPEPCLEITAYAYKDVVLQRKLCGKIFTEVSPGKGSCHARTMSTSSTVLLAVSLALWVVVAVGSCYCLGPRMGFFVSSIVLIFLVVTLLSAGVALARGVPQWDLQAVLIIALVQMVTIIIYCGLWLDCGLFFYMTGNKPAEGGETIENGVDREKINEDDSTVVRRGAGVGDEKTNEDDDTIIRRGAGNDEQRES